MRSDGWTGGVDAMQAEIPEITSMISRVHRSTSVRTVAPGNNPIVLWRDAAGIGFVVLTGKRVSLPVDLLIISKKWCFSERRCCIGKRKGSNSCLRYEKPGSHAVVFIFYLRKQYIFPVAPGPSWNLCPWTDKKTPCDRDKTLPVLLTSLNGHKSKK